MQIPEIQMNRLALSRYPEIGPEYLNDLNRKYQGCIPFPEDRKTGKSFPHRSGKFRIIISDGWMRTRPGSCAWGPAFYLKIHLMYSSSAYQVKPTGIDACKGLFSKTGVISAITGGSNSPVKMVKRGRSPLHPKD